MDDETLNSDLVEWLSQKKSEWLGAIIAHQPQDDLNFDQLHHYEKELNRINQDFDESFEWVEDKIFLKTYLKFLAGEKLTILVVVSVETKERSLPVFFFATHYRSVADLFCKGEYYTPPKH
jgi:hypothetical protein